MSELRTRVRGPYFKKDRKRSPYYIQINMWDGGQCESSMEHFESKAEAEERKLELLSVDPTRPVLTVDVVIWESIRERGLVIVRVVAGPPNKPCAFSRESCRQGLTRSH